MTLDNKNEDRVREAFAALTDTTPLGADYEDLTVTKATKPRFRPNGSLVFGSAFAVVAIVGVLAWTVFSGSETTDLTVPVPVEFAGDPADLEALLPPDRPIFTRSLELFPPTFEEYREVVEWTVACIEAVGVEVIGFGTADEGYGSTIYLPGIFKSKYFVWLPGEADPDMPAGSGTHADAYCRQWSNYDTVFNQYVTNPSQEDLDAWHDAVRACLTDIGIDYDDLFGEPVTYENGLTVVELEPFAEVPPECWP